MSTVFWALVVLGVLIFVHELGHFLIARLFGVRVEVFSLGFGPRIVGWKSADGYTDYQVSAIPLGGYVKMLGEAVDDEEPITEEERPFSFGAKSVGQRFGIVLAGPAFNFFFAVIALAAAFMLGIQEKLPVVGKVSADMPAAAAGLKTDDRITFIDETPIDRWEALSRTIRASEGRPVTLTVERDQSTFQVEVAPRVTEIPNLFGEPTKAALIGITPGSATVLVKYGPWDALVKGGEQTWRMIDLTLTGIWKLITRVVSADQVGGPLLIAELAGKSAEKGATNLLFFMALISVNLGILNLLPIPVLDGGHLFFFSIEALKGSPLSENAQFVGQRIGMALLAGLMILAFYNDLVRLFFSHE